MAIDKNKVVEHCDAYGNYITIITKNIAYIRRHNGSGYATSDGEYAYLSVFMTGVKNQIEIYFYAKNYNASIEEAMITRDALYKKLI